MRVICDDDDDDDDDDDHDDEHEDVDNHFDVDKKDNSRIMIKCQPLK